MATIINPQMTFGTDHNLESENNALASKKNDVTVDEVNLLEKKFNLPLEQLYNLSLRYYRDKERNGELIIPYNKRLLFMAYAKQVKVGPYSQSSDEAGWFDLVGNDRT
uniref:ACB domain-containing protein n=1 Tax=Syphacia muris TaxID=451379 RepID=A0A0N5APB8_9BILA